MQGSCGIVLRRPYRFHAFNAVWCVQEYLARLLGTPKPKQDISPLAASRMRTANSSRYPISSCYYVLLPTNKVGRSKTRRVNEPQDATCLAKPALYPHLFSALSFFDITTSIKLKPSARE